MTKRLLLLPLVVAGCSPGRDTARAAHADSLRHAEARAIPAVAFRIPTSGGALSVYTLPALDTTPWGAGSHLAGARSAFGVDLVGRRLLFRDTAGAIASFDLVALRQKTIAARHTVATMAADGALLAVDSNGGITESQTWGTRQWSGSLGRGVRDLFAAPGSRLIAIRHGRGFDSLQIAARETGIALTQAVPESEGRAATRDGDAFAFSTDSGVVVFEDREMERPWFVRLSGKPRAVVFSPSGHRLYVALSEKSELAVIDRFTRRERSAISLPGPAGMLRPDPWGRAILIRGEGEREDGETWIVSTADGKVSGRVPGTWASDLPAVSQSGVLLIREGAAVVARDLRSLDSLGAVAGGARDLWFAGRWVPSSAAAAARADVKPTTSTRQPAASIQPEGGAPVRPPTPESQGPRASANRTAAPANPQPSAVSPRPAAPPQTAAPTPAFYVQLIATRSEDAARAMAAQIAADHPVVVPPRPGVGDDNWRVMIGPFRTRDAADSTGRVLGRSYWIVDRSRDTSRP